MSQAFWVEPVGKLVIARIRGEATEQQLQRCQERVLAIVEQTGNRCVLYDLLEAHTLSPEVAMAQVELDESGAGVGLRRAIVVPNSRLAFMARIAFGGSEHRIYYSDLIGAIKWLEQDDSPCADEAPQPEAPRHSAAQPRH